MVADQGVQIAAGVARLRLEFHQQIHDLARIGRPVGHVADLHQMCRPPAPVVAGVDQPGLGQHVVELGVVAVQVAKHHDLGHVVPGRLGGEGRGGEAGRQGQNQTGQDLGHRAIALHSIPLS